ncbi:acetyl-CoA C-acyltransferase [Pseudomonas sp. No.117]
MKDPIVIVAAARTPMGALGGELAALAAPQLGSAVVRAVLERGNWSSERVDEVLLGCVLPAGLGQAPARQAALAAGLAQSTRCTTLNKMCGSGMQAVILGHDLLRADSAEVVLAGGMESMSRAPYLLAKARSGYRLGHGALIDSMFLDGLEDAYEPGRLMGAFAEDCAARLGIARERQDAYALSSLERARQAQASGAFAAEIVPVAVAGRKETLSVDSDEQPRRADPARIPTLKPAFREGGSVTAANASSISDGAAALLLMRASTAAREGLIPLATIRGHAAHAGAPGDFPTAPIGAIRRLLERIDWQLADVDLFEINEAFAMVALAAQDALGLDPQRLNVHGGACALGHPIGASGARILVTLIHALHQRGLRRGVAAICIGGGEATALALELND